MVTLIFLCLLCLISGACQVSRLSLNNLWERVIMVFTFAAAQLLLTIQCLSLFAWLTGSGLMIANVAVTLLSVGLSRLWPPVVGDRLPWRTLCGEAWRTLEVLRKETLVLALLAVALASVVVYCSLGAVMLPLGDSYHFEMPLFWIQHHSIAPFPVNNPRITTTSFVGEALALPGYLYAHTGAMFVVVALGAGLLSLGVVFSLARRIGCSLGASICAAAMTVGFTDFALTFLSARPESYLAGMWAGASLLFLMDSLPAGPFSKSKRTCLGCSILCFLMACGAKNTTTLLAPVYLIALAAGLGRSLFKRPALLTLTLCGGIALLCSGVAWNYTSNQLWYGDPRGPRSMQDHVSHEFALRSIWTRLCRGTVLLVFDTVWVPASARRDYAEVCAKAVSLLGGKQDLAEDDPVFCNFGERAKRPLKGCGLVGIAFLLPATVAGIGRCLGARRGATNQTGAARLGTCLVLLFAFGSFMSVHAMLRWQSIGLLRLAPTFSVMAAPLCGLLLERRWQRMLALGLMLLSAVMFVTYDLSMIARRFDPIAENVLGRKILGIGREHGMSVECQWNGDPPQTFFVREDYSARTLSQRFLEHVSQPAVIGFIGDMNSESLWLFGRRFCNRIVPLMDIRRPDELLEPPDSVEYVVHVVEEFGQQHSGIEEWASKRNYRRVFLASSNNGYWLVAFQKNAASPGP